MNIKVAAFTVSEKSSNILGHSKYFMFSDAITIFRCLRSGGEGARGYSDIYYLCMKYCSP